MKNYEDERISALQELFLFENGATVEDKILNSGKRIRRSFQELFAGYSLTADDVLNDTVRVHDYTGYVLMKDISFYTYCEHHFAPFFGQADIIYQPNEIVTGLGKLVRLVKDVHARRLQIQEVMTQQIAEDVVRVLDAKGAIVRTRAKHLCICSRGPNDDGAWTEVIYEMGTLKGKSSLLLDSFKGPR